jgi:hypothetical protein
MIADAISVMDQPECLARFRSKGVTVGPIYDAGQLLPTSMSPGAGAMWPWVAMARRR